MSKAQSINRADIDAIRKSVYSCSQYMMPYSYIGGEQVYVMADGSVARVIECIPAPCSSKSDAELRAISESVSAAMSRFHQDTLVQIIVCPTTDITRDLDNYKRNGGDNHYIIGALEAQKIDFFRRTRETPMFSWKQGGGQFLTRRFRVVVIMTVAPDEVVGGAGAAFRDALQAFGDWFRGKVSKGRGEIHIGVSRTEQRFETMRKRLIERLNIQCRSFMNALNSRGVDAVIMPVNSFIGMFRALLHPTESIQDNVEWRPDIPLSHQIPVGDVTVDFGAGTVSTLGAHHRVASLDKIPPWTVPGYLSMPSADLSGLTILDHLNDGFISISATVLPKGEVRGYLEKREKHVKGGFAMKNRVPQLVADIETVSRWVEVENRNVFFSQLVVSLWDKDPDRCKSKLDHFKDKFSQMRLSLRMEQEAGPSLFFQSLPMGFAPNIKEAKRMFWLPDQALADLMPVYGMGHGTKNARFLAHNRAGEPVRYNLFDSNTNPHFVVCGASGSGKSFFVNGLIADFLRMPKSQVVCLDKGRSYMTLTTMLGADGSFNNIDLKTRTCINPCEGTYGEASGFLISFIRHLITQTEKEAPTSDEIGIISECIRKAFEQKQRPFPYTTYAKARKDHHGCWFHRLLKRFVVSRLDDMTLASIESAKQQAGGRTPEYRMMYIAQLRGRDGRTEWDRMDQVPEGVLQWFRQRQLDLVGDVVGAPGIQVLYPATSVEAAMEMAGYVFTPNRRIMALEVAREDDLKSAIDAGASLEYPVEFISVVRAEREKAAKERYGNADAAAIEKFVDESIQDIDPTEFFAWAPGNMIVQSEVYMSDVGIQLETHGDTAKSVASRLAAFHGRGAYAAFFDGKTGFQLANRKMICFELGELASAGDHILAAVVGALLQMIILYGQGDDVRSNQKMLVLEEFWQLMRVPMIADMVLNLYRTARKFNTCVGCVTQLITDFTGEPDDVGPHITAGRAIINAATTKFILAQPPPVVAKVDKLLNWTQEKKWLLGSVSSQKGIFSEILYDDTDTQQCDVMRFVATPGFYWVATSDGADNKVREQLVRQYKMEGKTHQDAVRRALDECSRMYPRGVAHGSK